MIILPNGVAAIEGDSHHRVWVEKEGLIHDAWMANILRSHIKPGDTVIDGGANIGTLTRVMLDAGAVVLAFEPNPAAFECLVHNCPEAQAYEIGLSDYPEACEMEIQENAGASYLVVPCRGDKPEKTIPTYAYDLDSFFTIDSPAPSLIKLDVEGFETKALRGAREIIARAKPIIICEVNELALSRAISSRLGLWRTIESMGYRIQILQPDCDYLDPQYDILCTPI